jgi:small subunit ribosomal protein S16
MLTIRFSRVGRKNRAQFRVVLQQHTAAPTGRHVAVLGSYDPHQKIAVLKADKIKEWIAKGAQVSNSAYNLFIKEGVIEGKKRQIKMEKPAVVEAPVAPVAPVADAPVAETPVAKVKEVAPQAGQAVAKAKA